ncbi:MAG: TIGR04086 family membrane protein, partial [Oscillospiraceae bacterium]
FYSNGDIFMFKLKLLILGVFLETGIFTGLLCLLAFLSKTLGDVRGSGYSLALELIACFSVFLGAFITARLAWEKGAIYGGITAAVFIILRVILSAIFTGSMEFSVVLIKSIILLGIGLVGGAMGIGVKKRKRI